LRAIFAGFDRGLSVAVTASLALACGSSGDSEWGFASSSGGSSSGGSSGGDSSVSGDDSAAPPIDTGVVATPDSAAAADTGIAVEAGTPGADCFGTKEIYPTIAGGREWCLPATADKSDSEWQGGGVATATPEPGVFHVNGSPRIPVASPAGKAWWRNVEITAYLRLDQVVPGTTIAPEWQLFARGERHVITPIDGATINDGVMPPAGTPVWPGYPFSGMIDGHCVASSYKGYILIDGRMWFKKEISHTSGYTGSRDIKQVWASGVPTNQWLGFKTIIRNFNKDTNVHVESWLDQNATGSWVKINDVDDTGGWTAAPATDGCNAAPFNYASDQLVTWAGPYVYLRFDNLSSDFKAMGAREIEPLP
jgi:hypothetical protein